MILKKEMQPAESHGDKIEESLSLTQMAYNKIKAMMLNSELVPGQRLILVDLGKRLGVSRTPVQYALNRLEAEGMLDFRPNQGFTVHEITPQEVNALYEAREVIELAAIKKAIERLTPEDVQNLKIQKERCEKAILDNVFRGRLTVDHAFHEAYVEMGANQYLSNCFHDVYQHLYLRRIDAFPADRARQVMEEHNDIFSSIASGDLNSARRHITRHIRASRSEVFSATS